MAWRVAGSLITLRNQVNAQWPVRRKENDGTIGDANHSARLSDHNPDDYGVVRAIDITHDPANGLDSRKLADLILAKQDPRLKYVISFNRIGSGPGGTSPGVWRPYKVPPNKNPHDHHCHISVIPRRPDGTDPADGERLWDLAGVTLTATPPAPNAPVPPPTLRPGASNEDVAKLQRLLGVEVTGKYVPLSETEWALRLFQVRHDLTPDGVAGPQTWKTFATIQKPG